MVIAYPSGERKIVLGGELVKAVKNLALGLHKLACKSLWQLTEINQEINDLVLAKLEDEMQLLCSKKDSSILRNVSARDLKDFSLENLRES